MMMEQSVLWQIFRSIICSIIAGIILIPVSFFVEKIFGLEWYYLVIFLELITILFLLYRVKRKYYSLKIPYKYLKVEETTTYFVESNELNRDIEGANNNEFRCLSAMSEHTYECEANIRNKIDYINNIDHKFNKPYKTGIKWNISEDHVKKSFRCDQSANHNNSLFIKHLDEYLLHLSINIFPPLQKSDKFSYSFVREYSGAAFLSNEDIEKANKINPQQIAGTTCSKTTTIKVPTNELIIKLKFPQWYYSLIGNIVIKVSYNGNNMTNLTTKIQKRIKHYIADSNSIIVLSLTQEDIIIGYTYAFEWTLPNIENIKKNYEIQK